MVCPKSELIGVAPPKELEEQKRRITDTLPSLKLTNNLILHSTRIEDVHVMKDLPQVWHFIRHAQETHMLIKITSSLAHYLARTKNAHVEQD